MGKAIAVMVIIVAAVAIYLIRETRMSGEPPSTIMPQGARTLDSAMYDPEGVIGLSQAGEDFTDRWLTGTGWSGDVVSVVDSGKFRVIRIRCQTRLPTSSVFIRAEAGKAMAEKVRIDGFVRVTGRIAAIELTDDPMIRGQTIVLDSVTVHEAR